MLSCRLGRSAQRARLKRFPARFVAALSPLPHLWERLVSRLKLGSEPSLRARLTEIVDQSLIIGDWSPIGSFFVCRSNAVVSPLFPKILPIFGPGPVLETLARSL